MDTTMMEHDGLNENESDNEKEVNNSSDSDSALEDDEDEKQRNIVIQNLEEKINVDSFDYGSYTGLIEILRSSGDLTKLRLIRERFAEKYSLRPEIWLEWIQDELNIAATKDEKKQILNLFERAVHDFHAINLWLAYLEYSINNPDLLEIEEIQLIFEKALLYCSKQMNDSSKIYTAYINYELGLLEKNKSNPEFPHKEHEKRIVEIYKNQLSESHKNHEDTWSAWLKWSKGEQEDLREIYGNSCKLYDKVQIFEKKLISDINIYERVDIILEYSKYIFDWKDGVFWVSSLFERTLCELCYEPSLWIAYIDTTLSIDKQRDEILKSSRTLFERALKSCPWSGPIWTRYLRALVSSSQSQSDIIAIVERALNCPLGAADTVELWLEYITYFKNSIKGDWKETSNREKLSALCDRACTSVAQWFGEDGDPECKILKYCARIELLLCEDYERFQALWQDIRTIGNNASSANSWLEYLSVLRLSKQPQSKISKIYGRAIERTKDYPELIAEAWLNYERDCGSWESYTHATQTVASKNRKIELLKKEEYSRKSDVSQNLAKKRKLLQKSRPIKTTEEKSPQQELDIPTKKVKLAEKSPELNKATYDDDPKKTVFLSNLAYNLTEKELNTWLKPTGEPLTIRLVKAAKGTNKGYAYIVFNTETEVEEALKRDREPLNSRPVFVSRIRQGDNDTPAFRYSTNLEPNKLFIKGLASTTNEETIEKIFSKYGKCKARLVTFRNGHSKGLAFVEYNNEMDAKQALINLDGSEIDSNIIIVQLSQPPVRKQLNGFMRKSSDERINSNNETQPKPVLQNVLGGGRRRDGRGSAFFLPRAVTLKSKP